MSIDRKEAETGEAVKQGLYTIKEASAYMSVSERTVWEWTAPRGELPVVKLGRSVRYRPEDLEAFVTARIVGGAA